MLISIHSITNPILILRRSKLVIIDLSYLILSFCILPPFATNTSTNCAIMLFSTGKGVTALRGLTRFNAIGFRCMSVTNISDLEATEKFTETNPKSVLYFTATWYVPFKIEVIWCCYSIVYIQEVFEKIISVLRILFLLFQVPSLQGY